MRNSTNYFRCLQFIFLLLFTTLIHAQTDYWIAKNNGIPNIAALNMRSLVVNSVGDLFALARGQGVFISTDNGENWVEKNNGLTDLEVNCGAVNSSDEIFIGTMTEGIFKTTDNGENWTLLETGLNFNGIRDIFVASNGYIFAASSFEGVIRSTNNGANWFGVNAGLNGGGSPLSIYEDLAGQMLVGTSFGAIYFSNSYGDGWTKSSNGLPNTTTAPVLAIIENSDENYFAATGSGVYRSTDYGLNWSQVHNGGGNGYVHSIELDHSDNLFIGTGNSGVYRSINNGVVWDQINSGLTHLGIYSMVVNPTDYIFVATGNGIFMSNKATVSVEDEHEKLITDFSLKQNYPNPFNPSTKIEYFLKSDERVTIRVLDLLGKTVETLLDQYQTEGHHELEFNANEYSSGIYFYQMQAGSFNQTKKMLLIR